MILNLLLAGTAIIFMVSIFIPEAMVLAIPMSIITIVWDYFYWKYKKLEQTD